MSDELKYCKFCDKEKPIKDFCKSGFAIKNICRACNNEKQREKHKASKNWNELKKWLIETYYLYIPEIASNSSVMRILNKMQELEGNNE